MCAFSEVAHTAPLMGFVSRLATPTSEHGPPELASLSTFPSRAFSAPQGFASRWLSRPYFMPRPLLGFFAFRVFPTPDSRDHFWPDTLLTSQDSDECGGAPSREPPSTSRCLRAQGLEWRTTHWPTEHQLATASRPSKFLMLLGSNSPGRLAPRFTTSTSPCLHLEELGEPALLE